MTFADQLKSSIDIVDVVGQYVKLRKAGTRYVGLCPFHTEKTPSFGVHSVHQFYKCFGCGAGGDAIKFVMEIEGLPFVEAMRRLADQYGIAMPKRADYSDPDTRLRAALYRMHEIARDLYRDALCSPAGADARAYFARRGVSDALVDEFQLGLAPASGQLLARAFEKERFETDALEGSGLVMRREAGGYYDRFRGRLMFPIHDESGRVIAFGGRALAADQDPKYLNSAETKLYDKSRVLYNLHRAKTAMRKNERAVLVEGYMDVIGAWSAGVSEVIAGCGTSLTINQIRTIRRHAQRVVVNFDADAAGIKAAEKYIDVLLGEEMRVRVLELAGGLDPDEYVKEHGAEAYREAVDKAPGYFYWLADRARARFDMRTTEGRVEVLKFLLPAVQRVSDKLDRATIAADLATYLGIEPGLLLERFRTAATERRETRRTPAPPALKPVESMLLTALLASEAARREVLPELQQLDVVRQFTTRRIFEAIFAMDAPGGRFDFAELDGRLEEPDRLLLANIVFADKEEQEAEGALERARACLVRLGRDARIADLKARMEQAAKAGMLEEIQRLDRELATLKRG